VSLEELAALIHHRNKLSDGISKIISRPALTSHIGEYIASKIFNIQLDESATSKGIDGRFKDGPLRGKTVNIKLYGKKENLLDSNKDKLADYYLVLSGPDSAAESSRGKTRPLVICQVHLFKMGRLVPDLERSRVKIGIATSVRKQLWDEAIIYPHQRSSELVVTTEQRRQLSLFREKESNKMV